MSHAERIATAPLAAVHGVVAKAAAAVVRAWTIYRNRRAVGQLLAFDDHMLRDIGLTRGDVAASLAMPHGEDPSTRLRILAVERRAARRAQQIEALRASAQLAAEAAIAPSGAQRSPV